MSLKVNACIAFAVVNAATAFVISWLMQVRITSFDIVAVEHGWDMTQKTEACQSAGVLYLMMAACLSAYALLLHFTGKKEQLRRYDVELTGMAEGAPLLRTSNNNNGSQLEAPQQGAGTTGGWAQERYGANDRH
uniref:Uncharacterized protein n=1 Tax=Trypanosoma congolense (strain IL3000) TaxID=1068625 RepID=G0UL46_TRYCI|nr:conserved hypothetical protein [Trypanosoma congolense IL3000]